MREDPASQDRPQRKAIFMVLLPTVAVLCAAIGFVIGRISAISALPPGGLYSAAENQDTQTPFSPSPTQTPTPKPTSTPEPTPTPIGPPVSLDEYERLFAGVFYKRQTSSSPRPYIAHIVIVDLNKRGIKLMVTPEDGLGNTTSEFLETYGLAVAINGDGWEENSGFDPIGFAASRGKIYSEDSQEPTIYIFKNGEMKFGGNPPEKKIWYAISGSHTLVKNGRLYDKISTCALIEVYCQHRAPRTSIGISAGNYLIIIVVEGPPSDPREALTLEELAQLHLKLGSEDAIAMDGGGSSTLVVQNGDGPQLLNSPTDGTEREVANHLGIFARSISGGDD